MGILSTHSDGKRSEFESCHGVTVTSLVWQETHATLKIKQKVRGGLKMSAGCDNAIVMSPTTASAERT